MNQFGMFLQIVLGVIVVRLTHMLATSLMVKNNIIIDHTRSVNTPIFKGWIAGNSYTNRSFNTFNPFAKNFRDMPRSVNQHGGISFTWSIWTRFDDVSAQNLKDKVIFMYGDKQKYTLTKSINDKYSETTTDYVIKCPLIKFDSNGEGLIIQFNSNEMIDNEVKIDRVKSSNETVRSNILAMLPGKWMLWTFVFQDNVPFPETQAKGIEVKMYVNDFLHRTERIGRGSLRLNKGFVTVLPEPINIGYLADLTYHNYALKQTEISRILANGVTNKTFNEMNSDGDFNAPKYVTEYNKLEIYNI